MKPSLRFIILFLALVMTGVGLFLSLRGDDPVLPGGGKVIPDLAYVTNGHPRQKLDLYVPAVPKGPLLVWIHGGGWVSGDRKRPPIVGLLAQGYCVASLEYRFSNDAVFPAQIEDCKAAIRWLRAHAGEYGYDPKRIGAFGASAGGHLTALLATTVTTREFDVGENLAQSSAIQCGIDDYGPADFPGWKPASDNPGIQRSGTSSVAVKLLGGSIDEKMDLARKASPLTWVSKESAPLFIQHGTKDPIVGIEQSQELADKYKAAGVEVIFNIIEGAGHGGPEFTTPVQLRQMVEFLNKHLAQP